MREKARRRAASVKPPSSKEEGWITTTDSLPAAAGEVTATVVFSVASSVTVDAFL
jgi:hypothetical protein